MYLCFEEDDKRMAFPEHSLLAMDENGYTLKGMAPGKSTRDMIFLKFSSYKGCTQTFPEALTWIRKKPRAAATSELEITNSAGIVVNEFTSNGAWSDSQPAATPQAQAQPRPAAPAPPGPAQVQRPAQAPGQPGAPVAPGMRPPQAARPVPPPTLPEAPKF